MRATSTEIGCARDRKLSDIVPLARIKLRARLLHPRQPVYQRLGNHHRIKRAICRKEVLTRLVPFANDHRRLLHSIKNVTGLGFNQPAFFFDHDQQIQTFGKGPQPFRLQRPDQTDFVSSKPDFGCLGFVQPQICQG